MQAVTNSENLYFSADLIGNRQCMSLNINCFSVLIFMMVNHG